MLSMRAPPLFGNVNTFFMGKSEKRLRRNSKSSQTARSESSEGISMCKKKIQKKYTSYMNDLEIPCVSSIKKDKAYLYLF